MGHEIRRLRIQAAPKNAAPKSSAKKAGDFAPKAMEYILKTMEC